MKRILHFGGVLLALGMLLASCNIGVGDGQVAGDSVRNTSNVEGITIGISNIGNTGRTILPADWNDGTAEKLTYVLLGKKANTTGYETKAEFSYSQLKSGTAVVNLDLIEWDLKLIGYIKDENYETHPCLEKELLGEDFSKGKKAVVFDLKPVDPTKTSATGNVDVTIAWTTTKPKRLEFGIYDTEKTTEEIVKNITRDEAIASQIKTDSSFAVEGIAHEMSFQTKNIKAGIYKFAAVFYNDEDEGEGEVIGYYIDRLYVDGGNDSIATVNYGDKFNTQPENPTWLAVETVFKPQKLTATNTTVNDEYYAKFHWNDVSNNETGFELVITDDNGKVSVVTSEKDEDHLISDKWYNGPGIDDTTFNTTTNPNNLDAGSTWVVLKLKTQTLYTAKIRAINKYTPDFDDTDDDDFCDNLNQNGDGKGCDYAPIVESEDVPAKKQFGMFTVNYALSEGNVTEAEGEEATDASVKNYVVGFNYSSEQQDLMTDNILSYPYVSRTGFVFDHWEDTTPKRLDVIDEKNKNNLNLKAVWSGSDVYVFVTFPSYTQPKAVKIVDKWNIENTLKFRYNKDEEDDTEDKNTITVNAGASLKTPITFELSEMGNNGKIVPPGTSPIYGTITPAAPTWTWEPTEKTTPGFYCLQITGQYEDTVTGRTLKLCGNVYIQIEN